jgi:hypothetical protein
MCVIFISGHRFAIGILDMKKKISNVNEQGKTNNISILNQIQIILKFAEI